MKLSSAFLILAGSLIISASAWAVPPDVKEIEQATKVINDCAKIADEIAALKVPEGHAQARAIAYHNAEATDPKEKVAIEPVHDQFMKQMDEKVKRLDECGKSYEVAIKASESRIDALMKSEGKDEDGAPILDILHKYNDAQKRMEASAASLSADRQIQSYVHKTLRAHFIVEVKKP